MQELGAWHPLYSATKMIHDEDEAADWLKQYVAWSKEAKYNASLDAEIEEALEGRPAAAKETWRKALEAVK